MFFQWYTPEHFCREYVEIKKTAVQLSMFMSVVLGLKPLMDDWVRTEWLNDFKKMCSRYGLSVREDVIFEVTPKEKLPPSVLGREYLTTTSAFAHPAFSRKKGEMHVFISKQKKFLTKGMWYPVIINNRVIFQPRIDSLQYGYALGYPACCVAFFRKYNNWYKYSYLYEAHTNTRGVPNFLCNPFLKDTPYSYIYHMPCRYDCAATITLARKLRSAIKKREPEYVRRTDAALTMPFLVLYERKFYAFEGTRKDNSISYKQVYFVSPDARADCYGKYFKEGDRIVLEGRKIIVSKGKRLIKTIDIPLKKFAPEYPFIIQFRKDV